VSRDRAHPRLARPAWRSTVTPGQPSRRPSLTPGVRGDAPARAARHRRPGRRPHRRPAGPRRRSSVRRGIDVASRAAIGAVAIARAARRHGRQPRRAVPAHPGRGGGLAELRVATFRHVHDLSTLHVQASGAGRSSPGSPPTSRPSPAVRGVGRHRHARRGRPGTAGRLAVMLVYDCPAGGPRRRSPLLYALLLLLFQRVLRRAYDRVRVRVGESLAAISEAIAGLPTIRAYGAEDRTRPGSTALDAQFRAEFRTGALGRVDVLLRRAVRRLGHAGRRRRGPAAAPG
jgi:hypothetical protein